MTSQTNEQLERTFLQLLRERHPHVNWSVQRCNRRPVIAVTQEIGQRIAASEDDAALSDQRSAAA